MVKRAAIDIGTNSVRLLVAEIMDRRIKKAFKETVTTRLGQGLVSTGQLSKTAIDRTVEAVEGLTKKAISMGAQSVLLIATSAVRDAANGREFIEEVQRLGLNTRVLSGEQEAELGFLGATAQTIFDTADIVVIDIGGGSTELVCGNETGVKRNISVDLGAVRLTESLAIEGPINRPGLQRISDYITTKLHRVDLPVTTGEGTKLIGIGGTITNLAAIMQGMVVYDRDLIHGYVMSRDSIEKVLERLVSMELEDRKKVPGLQPGRADIIVAGIMILICVMDYWDIGSIEASEWDNLEGLIYSYYILHHKLAD